MSDNRTRLGLVPREAEEPGPVEATGKAPTVAQARHDELKAKGYDRFCRAPTAALADNGDGFALEISRSASDMSQADVGLLFNGSLGSTDKAFADGLTAQLVNACSGWETIDRKSFAFSLAVVQGIEPRDEIEGMLGAQMAIVHIAALRFGRNLICAETLAQRDSCERTLNKLTRTFAMQMEALKRYRSTGEQKVTVQHVTVNDGGQAVVGNVTTGGRGAQENER